MCCLTRASSCSSHSFAAPGLGAPFCLSPCAVGRSHGRSPTSDHATSVAPPAAMLLASGLARRRVRPEEEQVGVHVGDVDGLLRQRARRRRQSGQDSPAASNCRRFMRPAPLARDPSAAPRGPAAYSIMMVAT